MQVGPPVMAMSCVYFFVFFSGGVDWVMNMPASWVPCVWKLDRLVRSGRLQRQGWPGISSFALPAAGGPHRPRCGRGHSFQ